MLETSRSASLLPFVLSALAWLLVVALAGATVRNISAHQQDLEDALEADKEASRQVQARWGQWDGAETPTREMWDHPPWDAATGVAVVRYCLRVRNQRTDRFLHRLLDLPVLLELWYRTVPPADRLDPELVLLASARYHALRDYGSPVPLSATLAIHLCADLETEMTRRFGPARDPELKRHQRLVLQWLIELLDDPGDLTPLRAMEALSRGGRSAIPLLQARVDREGPRQGRVLAFLALARAVAPESRKGLLRSTWDHSSPGVRVAGLLESGRLLCEECLAPTASGAGHERTSIEALVHTHVARFVD